MLLKVKNKLSEFSGQLSIVIALVAELIIFGSLSKYFFTINNFKNVMLYVAYTGMMAAGATIPMLMGNLDISQWATATLSGVVATILIMNYGWPSWVVIFVVIRVGVIVGLFNGFIVSVLKFVPMIATMSSMLVIRSVCYILTESKTLLFQDKMFNQLGTGFKLGMPNSMWLMLAVFLVLSFVLRRTRFGHNAYAVGANKGASFLAGIPIVRIQIIGYIISAACAAFAGIIMTAQVGAIVPATGVGQEMEVIAAIVLGGLSLDGGEGKLSGTFLGAIVMTLISNGLTLLSVQSYYQMFAKGIILLVAVYIDSLRKNLTAKSLKKAA